MNKNHTDDVIDFSSASAVVGGLDSFLEEGVSFDTNDKQEPTKTTVKEEDDILSTEDDDVEVVEPIAPKPVTDVTINLTSSDDDTPRVESLDYKSVINKLVESKLWEGFDTLETEDGEISFDELDVNEELFIEIFKQKVDELKDKTNENSTKGLSDFTKHLLQIEKNGGNVSQALQTYQTYQSPLEELDLSRPIDQQKAVFLKYQAKGLEPEITMKLIEGLISDGTLEDEALKADMELRSAVDKQMEALNAQAVTVKAQKQEQLKVYRTAVKESLNVFDLNENYKKKIVDLATKEENGEFAIDSLYFKLRNDPEKAAALLLFVTDPEEYNKQITTRDVRSTQLDTFKKLKLTKKGGDTIRLTSKTTPPTTSRNSVDLKEIFGN